MGVGGDYEWAPPVCDEDLDTQATRLFALVSEGILAATAIFLTGDRAAIRGVVANEQRINDGFSTIERSCRTRGGSARTFRPMVLLARCAALGRRGASFPANVLAEWRRGDRRPTTR